MIKNVTLIFWVTWPHTGRIVTQWPYCKQSKDWRGQIYLQPLLLRSEISLFWRTSCARGFKVKCLIEIRLFAKFNYFYLSRSSRSKILVFLSVFSILKSDSKLILRPYQIWNRSFLVSGRNCYQIISLGRPFFFFFLEKDQI